MSRAAAPGLQHSRDHWMNFVVAKVYAKRLVLVALLCLCGAWSNGGAVCLHPNFRVPCSVYPLCGRSIRLPLAHSVPVREYPRPGCPATCVFVCALLRRRERFSRAHTQTLYECTHMKCRNTRHTTQKVDHV